MFARVIHFDVRSERIQKGYRSIVEHVLPALEMQKGYSSALLLANSQQGKMLAGKPVGERARDARHRRGLPLVSSLRC